MKTSEATRHSHDFHNLFWFFEAWVTNGSGRLSKLPVLQQTKTTQKVPKSQVLAIHTNQEPTPKPSSSLPTRFILTVVYQ